MHHSPTTPTPPAQHLPTRGVILLPSDLSLPEWPLRAAEAGLNTIALHVARQISDVTDFVQSDPGRRFLADCRKHGIAVEYALHAMSDLLPRDLWERDSSLFRVDDNDARNPDANCCPSNADALAIIAENAVRFSSVLRPTTNRFFYWPDDAKDWCACEKCRDLNASDQALLVENAILEALREHVDPDATLSHIAYRQTLEPPRQVAPSPGIFLEFAPFDRMLSTQDGPPVVPLSQRDHRSRPGEASNGEMLDALDANLEIFPRDTAQATDYWLDVSLMSKWTRPARPLVWDRTTLLADLAEYNRRGIRHITTFACYLDADYVSLHGPPWPLVAEYAAALSHLP